MMSNKKGIRIADHFSKSEIESAQKIADQIRPKVNRIMKEKRLSMQEAMKHLPPEDLQALVLFCEKGGQL